MGASPKTFEMLRQEAFRVTAVPPDFSDHQIISLDMLLPAASEPQPVAEALNFSIINLIKLKLSSDISEWKSVNDDIRASPNFIRIKATLNSFIHSGRHREEAQNTIDSAVTDLTNCIHDTFDKHKLI